LITDYEPRPLWCAKCERYTMHDAQQIGPFKTSDGNADIRDTDYHCQACKAMRLHPPLKDWAGVPL
jgi:hypothetical protein